MSSSIALSVVPILMTLLLTGAFVLGCIFYRGDLFEIARALKNKKTFSNVSSLLPRDMYPDASKSENTEIDDIVVEEAILALASYAKAFNPDWVIGMHVGGRLASVLVAKAAGIPKERCGYVRMTTRKEITFERQNGQKKVDVFDGRMLIIDDVSRTGRTFRNLKSFLVERNFLPSTLNNATEAIQNPTVIFSLDTVKFASLLVVSNDEINDGEFRPDWVYRRTSNKSVALPWSDLSEVVRVALENKSKSKPAVGDAKTLLEYETLCESYDVSLEKAELFLRKKSHSGWTRLLSTETKPSRYGIDAVERP